MFSSNHDIQHAHAFLTHAPDHAGRSFMDRGAGAGFDDERIPVTHSRGAYRQFYDNNIFRGRGRWNELYEQRSHPNNWNRSMPHYNWNMEDSRNLAIQQNCNRIIEQGQGRLRNQRFDYFPLSYPGHASTRHHHHRHHHHHHRQEESGIESDRGRDKKKSWLQDRTKPGGVRFHHGNRAGREDNFSERHEEDYHIPHSHYRHGKRHVEEINSGIISNRDSSRYSRAPNPGKHISENSHSHVRNLPLLNRKTTETSNRVSPSLIEQMNSLHSKESQASNTQSHFPRIPSSSCYTECLHKKKKFSSLSRVHSSPSPSLCVTPSKGEKEIQNIVNDQGNIDRSECEDIQSIVKDQCNIDRYKCEKEIQSTVEGQSNITSSVHVSINRKRQRGSAIRDYPEGCVRISLSSPSGSVPSQSIVPFNMAMSKPSDFSDAEGIKGGNSEDCEIYNDTEVNNRNSTCVISIGTTSCFPTKHHDKRGIMRNKNFEEIERVKEVRWSVSEVNITDRSKKPESIFSSNQEMLDIPTEPISRSINILEGKNMPAVLLQDAVRHCGSLNHSMSYNPPHSLSSSDIGSQTYSEDNVRRVSMCCSKSTETVHMDREMLDAELPDSSDDYVNVRAQPEVQHASMVVKHECSITAQNNPHRVDRNRHDEVRMSRPRAHTSLFYSDHRNADGFLQNDGMSARTLVKRTLHEFESLRREYLKSKDLSRRPDLEAAATLKQKGKCQNAGEKIIGDVPGVEVGDQFSYRIEMWIIGLHRQIQGGIDYIPGSRRKNGLPIATSIVASGGYEDDIDNGDKLIYTGQGGNNYKGGKCQESHQKLVRGNLAMKNCMIEQKPVRVIRGVPDLASPSSKLYTYDGLYDVVDVRYESGIAGYSVYHFTLLRRPGQPQLGSSIVKFVGNLRKRGLARPNLLLEDLSQGLENFPICVVNEVDGELTPGNFTYIRHIKYPMWFSPLPSQGCDCVGGCFDENKCSCARKNGGELPYNEMGYIIRDKGMVYECGKSCNCPSSCPNRVSQKGLRYQLEVFKTKNRGWGVRSVNSIQPGGFICEYIGELLSDAEAEQRIDNDEYLFELGNGNNKADNEGSQVVGADASTANGVGNLKEDIGYTIDAKLMGNVGRFINHSCSPNLFAQNVLYDYDDPRFPHVMFFAMENIPPMRELTYDYNYTLNEVHDANGNVKMKACYCGASDCKGRLY